VGGRGGWGFVIRFAARFRWCGSRGARMARG